MASHLELQYIKGVNMTVQGLLIFLLIALTVIAITWYVTRDARKRDIGELQVILITMASVFFFPFGLVLYFILRPSLKNKLYN